MSYIKLAVLLLQIVQYFIKTAERNGAIEEGEKRQIAKALTEVIVRAGVAEQIRIQVAGMTDAELDAELRGDT